MSPRQFSKIMKVLRKKCPPPCTTFHYKATMRESFLAGATNITELYLMYADTRVTIIEEILVFDTNAIVSAVGGSLGLFIGFSVFDTLKWMICKIWKYCATTDSKINNKQIDVSM